RLLKEWHPYAVQRPRDNSEGHIRQLSQPIGSGYVEIIDGTVYRLTSAHSVLKTGSVGLGVLHSSDQFGRRSNLNFDCSVGDSHSVERVPPHSNAVRQEQSAVLTELDIFLGIPFIVRPESLRGFQCLSPLVLTR